MSWDNIGSARRSPLSRLDFRAKLVITLTITFLALLWESLALSAALAMLTFLLCLVVGVRRSYLRSVLRMMLPVLAVLLVTQGFWNTWVGRTSLWRAPQAWWLIGGRLTLTSEGLAYGLMLSLRSLTLILAIPLAVFTTDLDAVIMGLVRMRVPYTVAFVFSTTLRFVPLLFAELAAISEAQRLRGLALEKMSLLQRLPAYARIAVPLILGTMVKSQQIELALAARAFSGSPQRTYLHETILRAEDYAVIIVSLAILLAALGLRATAGLGRFVM